MQSAILGEVQLHYEGWDVPGEFGFLLPAAALVWLAWHYAHRVAEAPVRPARSAEPTTRLAAPDPEPVKPRERSLGVRPAQNTASAQKRRFDRRAGNRLPVAVALDDGPLRETVGTILDRSRGGILLECTYVIPRSKVFRVRPLDAPEDLAWIDVEVRHARRKGDRWLMGCAFVKDLPWHVVLLLG